MKTKRTYDELHSAVLFHIDKTHFRTDAILALAEVVQSSTGSPSSGEKAQ